MENIYSLSHAYALTMFGSAVALMTLGVIIAFVKIPAQEQYRRVRCIGIGLVVCYFTLGAFSFFNANTGYTEEMDYVSLLVGSVQAAALTWVMVALMCSDGIPNGFFLKQTICAISLALSVGLISIEVPHMHAVVRVLTGLIYGLQCYLCMQVFSHAYVTALARLEDMYDDYMADRLRWATWGFYCGLAVGIVAYAVIGFGQWASLLFVFAYMVYYVMLSVVFIKYVNNLQFYFPIIAARRGSTEYEETATEETEDEEFMHEQFAKLGPSLQAWVEARGFCDEKTTQDIAETLGVSVDYLRQYVKDVYGDDFRTWRTRLRIEEACRMLIANPDMSVQHVSCAVGINNRGNFHSYFVRFTGMTPTKYREN